MATKININKKIFTYDELDAHNASKSRKASRRKYAYLDEEKRTRKNSRKNTSSTEYAEFLEEESIKAFKRRKKALMGKY